jgi:hypothetical protein
MWKRYFATLREQQIGAMQSAWPVRVRQMWRQEAPRAHKEGARRGRVGIPASTYPLTQKRAVGAKKEAQERDGFLSADGT